MRFVGDLDLALEFNDRYEGMEPRSYVRLNLIADEGIGVIVELVSGEETKQTVFDLSRVEAAQLAKTIKFILASEVP